MRHLKKFESSNSEKTGKYYTDEEILDFFQEFMDNNDFEVEIRNGEELNRYLSSFSGEYYIDIVKTILNLILNPMKILPFVVIKIQVSF